MPKIKLQSFPVDTSHGGRGIKLGIGRDLSIIPTEIVDIQTAADAAEKHADFAKRLSEKGEPACAWLDLCKGERAPRGFRTLETRIFVNC